MPLCLQDFMHARQGARALGDSVPASFPDAIDAVADFADPILAGEIVDGSWDPGSRRWRRTF